MELVNTRCRLKQSHELVRRVVIVATAVDEDSRVVVEDGSRAQRTKPVVVVLGDAEILGEGPQTVAERSSYHRRRRADGVLTEHAPSQQTRFEDAFAPWRRKAVVVLAEVAGARESDV